MFNTRAKTLGAGFIRSVVFFFQAEDGIRDIGVTGVQTCALPISPSLPLIGPRQTWGRVAVPTCAIAAHHPCTRSMSLGMSVACCRRGGGPIIAGTMRSGRGGWGEKGRSWGGPDHLKKKKKKEYEA